MGIVLDVVRGEIENGSAFERTTFAIPTGVNKIRVPSSAVVEELVSGHDWLEIYLHKTLAFDGDRPPMSIARDRDRFGLAYKRDGDLLTFATHHEWTRHHAGGATIHVLLRIPNQLAVEHGERLAGPFSEAHADPIAELDVEAIERRRQSPAIQDKLAALRGARGPDPMQFIQTMLADPSRLEQMIEMQQELMKDLYGVDLAGDAEHDDPWNDARLAVGWQRIETELDPAHTAHVPPAARPVIERGIVLGERWGHVVNGSAFERAILDVPGVQSVHVPEDATVETIRGDRIEIYLEKVLAYRGHPPQPMSIVTARHEVGVSYQQQGTRLWFRTFGAWDSRIEGGMAIRVVVRVPASLTVVRDGAVEDDAGDVPDGDFEDPPTNPGWHEAAAAPPRVPGRVFVPGHPAGADPARWRTLATELDPSHAAAVTPREAGARSLAALETHALRSALWELKSGLDQHQLAAFLRTDHPVELEAGLQRCLERLAPLAAADPRLAPLLAAGTALLHEIPRGDGGRWAERARELERGRQGGLAPRADAMAVWAGAVGDWFRGVIELFPPEMPTEDYFEGMVSLIDSSLNRNK